MGIAVDPAPTNFFLVCPSENPLLPYNEKREFEILFTVNLLDDKVWGVRSFSDGQVLRMESARRSTRMALLPVYNDKTNHCVSENFADLKF